MTGEPGAGKVLEAALNNKIAGGKTYGGYRIGRTCGRAPGAPIRASCRQRCPESLPLRPGRCARLAQSQGENDDQQYADQAEVEVHIA